MTIQITIPTEYDDTTDTDTCSLRGKRYLFNTQNDKHARYIGRSQNGAKSERRAVDILYVSKINDP